MGIEHNLASPISELRSKLDGQVFGLFPQSIEIRDGFLVFTYSNNSGKRPSPYRSEFAHQTAESVVYYNVSAGAMLGSAPRTETIKIPESTKSIRFEVEGGDAVDQNTGRELDDLNKVEFIRHFFPGLK